MEEKRARATQINDIPDYQKLKKECEQYVTGFKAKLDKDLEKFRVKLEKLLKEGKITKKQLNNCFEIYSNFYEDCEYLLNMLSSCSFDGYIHYTLLKKTTEKAIFLFKKQMKEEIEKELEHNILETIAL